MRHGLGFFFALMAVLAAGAACSSDPCEDLQAQAEPCADEIVREMALGLVEKDDKNQCRLYRDAWYVTYQPRCDSGGVDAGIVPDSGSFLDDAGTTDDDSIDASVSDAGSTD